MTLSHFRRTAFVPAFLAALIAFAQVAPVLAAADAAGSLVSGRILSEAGQPVVGARVLAYHLSSEEVFEAGATDAKGAYEIGNLPYGYFDVAVETPQGLYVTDQVVNVPPAGKVVLTLNLYPYSEASTEEGRSFPGTDSVPVGVARVQEKPKGGDFWKSPKGIATIAGSAAAVLLLVGSGGDDGGGSASPSAP